jgi:hypothetical protein
MRCSPVPQPIRTESHEVGGSELPDLLAVLRHARAVLAWERANRSPFEHKYWLGEKFPPRHAGRWPILEDPAMAAGQGRRSMKVSISLIAPLILPGGNSTCTVVPEQ